MIAATYEKIDRIQAVKRRNLEAQKENTPKTEVSYNKPIPVLMIACNRPTVSRALGEHHNDLSVQRKCHSLRGHCSSKIKWPVFFIPFL